MANIHPSSLSPLVRLPPQNAIVPFKEMCGLSPVANLKQCILALCPRLMGPDGSPPLLLFDLHDQYPNLEPQGVQPEVLKKVVTTYDAVSDPAGKAGLGVGVFLLTKYKRELLKSACV